MPQNNSFLLTATEQTFYHTLVKVLNGHFLVCPKVRMSDIVKVDKKKVAKTYTFLNKINSKHIDFMICHPQNLQMLVAIELDDSSHQQTKRQDRDVLVDGIFAAAGIPLVHIKVQKGYSREELIASLKPYLSK